MNLVELEILFDDEDMSIDGHSKDQLYKKYGIFLTDFHTNTLIQRGKKVIFNTNKSTHYLFKGKFQGFEHLVKRENKYNNKRQYDRD